jgi:hypothetical protein
MASEKENVRVRTVGHHEGWRGVHVSGRKEPVVLLHPLPALPAGSAAGCCATPFSLLVKREVTWRGPRIEKEEEAGERRRDGCVLGEELQEKWIKDGARTTGQGTRAGVLSKQGCVSRERPRSNI